MAHILVCVAWPYANASLHLGHLAGSLLPPDIFARFHRMRGNTVLMVSGSDEHGTPITVRADSEGVLPAIIAEKYHKEHGANLSQLGISFDLFFRTSDPFHAKTAHELFLKLAEKGDLDPREMDALFCPKESKFLPDRYVEGTCPRCRSAGARGDQCDSCGSPLDAVELVDPRCRNCSTTPEIRRTTHLFFRLSRFTEPLREYARDKAHWRPNVKNFTDNWLREGLKDRPVTRDLTWGVTVPLKGWENKRIYVWFEAVMGYLSASREWARRRGTPDAWKDWWAPDTDARHYYFLGKDNIPFHTIIWPAILLAAGGLQLPYDVPANEFLTMRGEKLSKSKGIVIPVPEYLAKFDPDPLRYHLTIAAPELHDTDFTWEEFVQRNNSELVAAFGNYVHRILHFTNKHFGQIPELGALDPRDDEALRALDRTARTVTDHLERCHFKNALEAIMELSRAGNAHVDARAPWTLIAQDRARCGTALHVALRLVQGLCVLAAPFLPSAAGRLWTSLGNPDRLEEQGWDAALRPLVAGTPIPAPTPLFRRIDPAEIVGLTGAPAAAGPVPPAAPKAGPSKATGGFPLDLRIGTITEAVPHPQADKLYVCQVDFGTERRQVVSGIRGWYTPEELQGRKAVFVLNLKKANLRGATSEAMVLAAEHGETVSLVVPERDVAVGTAMTPEGLPRTEVPKILDVTEFRSVPLEIRMLGGTVSAALRDGDVIRSLRTAEGIRAVPLRPVPDGARIH